MGIRILCRMTIVRAVVGLRWLQLASVLLIALGGGNALAETSASQDDVDALMRAGGIYLDIDELSYQLVSQISTEISQLSSEKSMSAAEQQATVRAARTAFDSERLGSVILGVLTERLSRDDIAARMEAHSTEFGRLLIATEYTEKRRASGSPYQAYVEAFEKSDALAWRRAAVADLYRRHGFAEDQAAMYVDVQIAVLVGLSRSLPELDETTVDTLTTAMRARQSEYAEAFGASGVSFTGWLYRDFDDADFERAMRFNDSPSAQRVYAALMTAYREAIVSGGLIYGRELVREQRAARSLVEI